ncbi:MAG TPA: hypothetical protein VMH02_02235 [Verrucomicrobiae bacterium]|nr:hypothetical protein [Verrucomicrobiae bacterium]
MQDRIARELDAEILRTIEAWHRHGTGIAEGDFDDLALRLFAYQIERNEPYGRFCASFGFSKSAMPPSWEAVPPVPAAAFKEATLATFDPAKAVLAFETSGTTTGSGGRHFFDTRALYDAALLAGFDRFVLGDGARLRYLNLVPNPADRPQSSLGYMMGRVSAQRGDGQTGWYVRGEGLLLSAFFADLDAAIAEGAPVCIASTAFALVAVLDALRENGRAVRLPAGSRVMETGGFKGRTRVLSHEELYERACERLGITQDAIVAEYGMTELTSQYYDDVRADPSHAAPSRRRKLSPPWLRARVVGPDGETLRGGIVGALVHVDLANRGSCVAVQTDDLGVQFDDGLVLIGRDAGASLRGCSLDAESLARL